MSIIGEVEGEAAGAAAAPWFIYVKIAAAIAVLLAAAAFGAYGESLIKDKEIAAMKLHDAKQATLDAQAVTKDLEDGAKRVTAALQGVNAFQDNLTPKINAILKGVKNEKPLPVGCAPDAMRVQSVSGAVSAANSAAGLR